MKKTLALLLTLTMLFTMVLPAGAFSFETVESVSTELPAEEVTSEPEAAALAAEVIPGSNLFTGTKALLTFDDESEADIFSPKEGLFTKSIVENPTSLVDETVTLDRTASTAKCSSFTALQIPASTGQAIPSRRALTERETIGSPGTNIGI